MDHRDKIRQNMELLKLDSLKDISLDDLKREIKEKFPAPFGDGRRLHVFMAWLHDRLTVIDTSDKRVLSREINEWATFLVASKYDKLDLAGAFEDWCHEQSAIDPSSAGRLKMAAQEIEIVLSLSFANLRHRKQAIMAEREMIPMRGFAALRPSFSGLYQVPEAYEPPDDNGSDTQANEAIEFNETSRVNEASMVFGNIHPDRLSAMNDPVEVDVHEDSPAYRNLHPNQLRDISATAIDLDTWKAPFIDLSSGDDSPNRQNEENPTHVPFLTGANTMVLENGRLPGEMDREIVRAGGDSGPDPATHLHYSRYFEAGSSQEKPPMGYVCNICRVHGHYIFDCPDRKPYPYPKYICQNCGIIGEHWVYDCPKVRDRAHSNKKWRDDKNNPPWHGPPTGRHGKGGERRNVSNKGSSKAHGGERSSPQYHRPTIKRRSQSPLPQPIRKRSCSRGFEHSRPASPLDDVVRYSSGTHIEAAYGMNHEAGKDARQFLRPRVLDLHTRVQEEGRLSYYDDTDEDVRIPLTDRITRAAPEQITKSGITEKPAEQNDTLDTGTSPAVIKKRCTEDVDVLIASHSVGMIPLDNIEVQMPPPVELGVTEKSLECNNPDGKPTYDQRVSKLFASQKNLWIRNIKRYCSWDLWGDNVLAKHTEEEDTTMSDADAVVKTLEPADIAGCGSGNKDGRDLAVTSPDSIRVADEEIPMAESETQVAQGSTNDLCSGQDAVGETHSAVSLVAPLAPGGTTGSEFHGNEMVGPALTGAEPLEPADVKIPSPKLANDQTPPAEIIDVIVFRDEVVEVSFVEPQSAEQEIGGFKPSDIRPKLPNNFGPRVGQEGVAGSYKAEIELPAADETRLGTDATQTVTTES